MHYRGGYILAKALCGPHADDFMCGAIAHPSIHLENMIFQRDTAAMFDIIAKPLLLMPAKVSGLFHWYGDG